MRPVMIAVGGDSGTGTSTLCLDDYHALDSARRKATGLTALDRRGVRTSRTVAIAENERIERYAGAV
jgi:hypothetical protein